MYKRADQCQLIQKRCLLLNVGCSIQCFSEYHGTNLYASFFWPEVSLDGPSEKKKKKKKKKKHRKERKQDGMNLNVEVYSFIHTDNYNPLSSIYTPTKIYKIRRAEREYFPDPLLDSLPHPQSTTKSQQTSSSTPQPTTSQHPPQEYNTQSAMAQPQPDKPSHPPPIHLPQTTPPRRREPRAAQTGTDSSDQRKMAT